MAVPVWLAGVSSAVGVVVPHRVAGVRRVMSKVVMAPGVVRGFLAEKYGIVESHP